MPSGRGYQVVLEAVGEPHAWSITVKFQACEEWRLMVFARNDTAQAWKLVHEEGGTCTNDMQVTVDVQEAWQVMLALYASATPDAASPRLMFSISQFYVEGGPWRVAGEFEYENVAQVTVESPNPVVSLLSRLIQVIAQTLKKAASAILSLLPDWLESVLRSSWQIVSGFAPPLFSLITDVFQIYPIIFMLVSLRYIITGDPEGLLNYWLMHVKIVKMFIDLGMKIIELLKP